MDTKVAIIGGGIIGTVVADKLAANGLNVTIFEKSPALGTGTTAACEGGLLLHTQGFFYPQLQDLITQSMPGWDEMKERFPTSFLTESFMRVAYNEGDWENTLKLAAHASKTTHVDLLDDVELHMIEPWIAPSALGAALVQGERSIDTARFMGDVLSPLIKSGCVRVKFNTTVHSVMQNGGSVEIVANNHDREEFDYAVIASGPHAEEKLLGKPPIDQALLTHGISAFLPKRFDLTHHILSLNGPEDSGLAYLVPCEGGIRVGATKKSGDWAHDLPIKDHLSELQRGVVGLCPAAKESFQYVTTFKGLRDMRDPYCNREANSNIISTGGAGGAGTTVSMGIAEQVLGLV